MTAAIQAGIRAAIPADTPVLIPADITASIAREITMEDITPITAPIITAVMEVPTPAAVNSSNIKRRYFIRSIDGQVLFSSLICEFNRI